MPKISEIYSKCLAEGKEKALLSQDLRVLISYHEGFAEPIDTLYHQADEMAHLEEFQKDFADLLNGKPVEYIIHQATFLNRKLYVDERVLIPRMETEELVANLTEKISDYYEPRNYLVAADIGTGSGAIALALKTFFPNWFVMASDISKPALEVAKKNISESGLKVSLSEGSGLEPFISSKTNLDIIISNPPYIIDPSQTQKSVKDYEPSTALWMNKDDNVYLDIFKRYKEVKKGSLLMAFEIGEDLKDYLTWKMEKYLSDYEFEFVNDLSGRLRFLFIFLR